MAAERKKNKKSEIKRKKGKEIKERETDVKKEKNEARPKTVFTSVSSHYEDFFPHRTESSGGPSVALKKVHKFKHLFATTNQQN
jgi:hypothetical protein